MIELTLFVLLQQLCGLCICVYVSVYTCIACVYAKLSAWKCVRVHVAYVRMCVCMKSDELIVAL